jgi:hypothetical protein
MLKGGSYNIPHSATLEDAQMLHLSFQELKYYRGAWGMDKGSRQGWIWPIDQSRSRSPLVFELCPAHWIETLLSSAVSTGRGRPGPSHCATPSQVTNKRHVNVKVWQVG